MLTGGELSRWRRRCQHAHHAEPHRLGGWHWPGSVMDHTAVAAHLPKRKEAAKLGPYLDYLLCEAFAFLSVLESPQVGAIMDKRDLL